jgi:hypothetical protein
MASSPGIWSQNSKELVLHMAALLASTLLRQREMEARAQWHPGRSMHGQSTMLLVVQLMPAPFPAAVSAMYGGLCSFQHCAIAV